MSTRNSEQFGLEMSNIPLINLRNEFNVHFEMLATPAFRERFSGRVNAIQTPWLIWSGMPNAFLSLAIQRAINGAESYISGMTLAEAGRRSLLNQCILAALRNPARLGHGIADSYYNKLPGLIEHNLALQTADPKLWQSTQLLYREVRNPLFHGYEVSGSDGAVAALKIFEHLAYIYDWIDTWADIEVLWPGASRLSRVQRPEASLQSGL